MIKQLLLGNKIFTNNLIQGPLAGVSAAPFRVLTSRLSKPAFTCTEMISCKTILHQNAVALKRFIHKDPDEGPVCFQLSSNNPHELGEAVKRVTDAGADLIDLNCGCPVKKIRSRGAGSSLLSNPQSIFNLISAMKQNTPVPVSIKIRVDNAEDQFNADVAKAVQDAGADFLIVHGRHWSEHYDTACRYESIQFFAENLQIPVIGNGDVACLNSLKKMLKTGCAGVMISRAGVGQPWLIAQLIAEFQQQNFVAPTEAQVGQLFLEHTERLIALLQNEFHAILQMRKVAKYYARALLTRREFCEKINTVSTLDELKKIINNYFLL